MLQQLTDRARLALIACLALSASLAVPVSAQSVQATILGQVVDEQGGVVAGAAVSAISEETSVARSASTSGDGLFTLSHLAPGRYRVAVEARGFRTFVETGLAVAAGEVRRLTPRLQVGGVNQEVTVVAPAGRTSTESMLKSELITPRLAGELPLNGRNYVELAVLAPGVYHRVGADEQGDGLSASGARADSAGFLLDGMVNRADRNATPGLTLPLEAIREVEIETSSYPADTGRTGGGQVSVVTRSGSNRFSGSASDFVRNAALDGPGFQQRGLRHLAVDPAAWPPAPAAARGGVQPVQPPQLSAAGLPPRSQRRRAVHRHGKRREGMAAGGSAVLLRRYTLFRSGAGFRLPPPDRWRRPVPAGNRS